MKYPGINLVDCEDFAATSTMFLSRFVKQVFVSTAAKQVLF